MEVVIKYPGDDALKGVPTPTEVISESESVKSGTNPEVIRVQSSMNIPQIIHCLEQTVRFSTMLATNDNSRLRDVVIAQLSFNLGRFCELAQTDGRFNWRLLERSLVSGDYTELITHAAAILEQWKAQLPCSTH